MEHISPKRTYVLVWAALMVLTVVTAAVSRIDLGPFSTPVALFIASCKGVLVVLFFMHAKYISGKTTYLVIAAGFFWLLILLFLAMSDYISRAWI
ncbi:MAG TPA: cytochrome C oxidase subunit IV family protein [Terriglobales bacterium]|nr:cytochrome C oxidase subunit IV family protein [Terriglobales bacterium]